MSQALLGVKLRRTANLAKGPVFCKVGVLAAAHLLKGCGNEHQSGL